MFIKYLTLFYDFNFVSSIDVRESIEGIFSVDNHHHIFGQPIDDINHNKQLRGFVYYVRKITAIECDDDYGCTTADCAPEIILCWADDTNKSQTFLERLSLDTYLKLMDERYIIFKLLAPHFKYTKTMHL